MDGIRGARAHRTGSHRQLRGRRAGADKLRRLTEYAIRDVPESGDHSRDDRPATESLCMGRAADASGTIGFVDRSAQSTISRAGCSSACRGCCGATDCDARGTPIATASTWRRSRSRRSPGWPNRRSCTHCPSARGTRGTSGTRGTRGSSGTSGAGRRPLRLGGGDGRPWIRGRASRLHIRISDDRGPWALVPPQ